MCSTIDTNMMMPSDAKVLQKSTLISGDNNKQISVIYIDYVIGENARKTESTLEELRQSANDSDVKAILLVVNSPGGAVTASDVIYNAVSKAKAKKPVVVYMGDVAASGGYYISCAGSHIIANSNTLTGSIGVIISSINITSAMEKIGVESQVYTSGNFKDMLSMTRPARDDERKYIQSLIEETYNGFLNIVSTNRNISIADLQAREAVDGRVITGKKALKIGLIDGLGYMEDAIAEAEKLAGIPTGKAMVHRYKRNDLNDLLNTFFYEANSENKIKVELSPNPLPQLKPGVPYLLPTAYVSGSSDN